MTEIASVVKKLSKDIENRRKSLSLTQVELANLAGVSARFMYDLESGKPTVSLDKFLSVVIVLGYELELSVSNNG